jgi:hypothetical protein
MSITPKMMFRPKATKERTIPMSMAAIKELRMMSMEAFLLEEKVRNEAPSPQGLPVWPLKGRGGLFGSEPLKRIDHIR